MLYGWLKPMGKPWLLVCQGRNKKEVRDILREHHPGKLDLVAILPVGETPFRAQNAKGLLTRKIFGRTHGVQQVS